MAAANHRERIRAGKISGPRNLGYGLFAGIDQIGIFFALEWIGTDAQHAVLALQNNLHSCRNVVGHKRRHADAEVYIKPIA